MKKEKKMEIQNLLLTIRVVSTLSLFECIFILVYYISALFANPQGVSVISSKLAIDSIDFIYRNALPYLIGIFILYLGGIFINYYLIKNDSKYAKRILIVEIVLLIIFMTGLFMTISGIL
jgi:NhaP-type Na+/H+ or K+/H+ antiporter